MDARTLEAAVSNKGTGSVDSSAQGKANTAPTETPEGAVANLLEKLEDAKADTKEAADKANQNKQKDKAPVGPLAQLFSDLKKKKEAENAAKDTAKAEVELQAPSDPLANMIK